MISHRERAVRALCLEEPDRVPIFELAFSRALAEKILGRTPYYANHFYNLELASKGKWMEVNEGLYRDSVDIARITGLDFLLVPSEYGEVTSPPEVLDDGSLRAYGQLFRKGGAEGEGETYWDANKWTVAWTAERAEKLVEDLHKAATETDNNKIYDRYSRINREMGDEYFICGGADGSWGPIVSNPPLLTKVLQWMYTNPSLSHRIIDTYTDLAIQTGLPQLDAGVHGMIMCVDYGYRKSSWMSPKHFHEFVEPALRRQCDAWHKRGAWAILHSDGNTNSILDHMVEGGIDAYQCIDVQAGMDLSEVKRRIGGQVCLIGNVAVQILEKGSFGDVEAEVERCIRSAADGGGYVISPSSSMSTGTNEVNYFRMIEKVKKVGHYSQ